MTVVLGFELIEAKIRELTYKEALYIPPRYIDFLEKFLSQEKFTVTNVYLPETRKFIIKHVQADEGYDFYIIAYPFEAWIIRNIKVIWRAKDKLYTYEIIRVLDYYIKYKYSIENLADL